MENEIKRIIQNLRNKKIGVNDIPEEYALNEQIITAEIQLGLRKRGKRGFDVISSHFFVEEELVYRGYSGEYPFFKKTTFDSFDSYYDYLYGDIYENACYKYYQCPKSTILDKKIDVEKLFYNTSFITNTIDDYTLTNDDEYTQAEERKKQCVKWFKKFNNCDTYAKFANMVKKYNKSGMERYVHLEVFFYNYIYTDVTDKKRFDIIMQYLATDEYPSSRVLNTLCTIYDADEVLQTYDSYLDTMSTLAKSTKDKRKRNLKKYILLLKDNKIKYLKEAYIDINTHFFVERINFQNITITNNNTSIYRYFESFEEFVRYRNGDLTNSDLRIARGIDVSMYKIDETTKLPEALDENLEYSVQKVFSENIFYVNQIWKNNNGTVLKHHEYKFIYFFDFVAFLKGDLSNADLLFCDGLCNLSNCDGIDFTNAKLRSSICLKFGIEYTPLSINDDLLISFKNIEQNENETSLALIANRDIELMCSNNDVSAFQASTCCCQAKL